MNESSVLQGIFEPNEVDNEDDAPAPDLPIYDMGDLGDVARLKAALDEEQEMAVDEAEAGKMPLYDRHNPTPDSIVQIDSDTDISSSEIQLHVAPPTRIEVAIPELAAERQIEYSAEHSEVVERLVDVREYRHDYVEYDLEFTDGRIDTVRLKIKSVCPQQSSELQSPRLEMRPCPRPTLTLRCF